MKWTAPRLVPLAATLFAMGCAVPANVSPRETALPSIGDVPTTTVDALELRATTWDREPVRIQPPARPVSEFKPDESPLTAPPASRTFWQSNQNSSGAPSNPWELQLGASGSNNTDFDAGGGSISASLGYFFTDVLEGSVRQLLNFSDAPNQSSANNGATRLAVDFHFGKEKVMPYIGANFGWVYGDGVNETFIAGPEGGVKIFLKDETFLLIGVEYAFFFEDSDNAADAFDDGLFIYNVGFGIRF